MSLGFINEIIQSPGMHMIRTIPAAKQMARTAQILFAVLPRHRPETAKTKTGGHQTNHQNTKPTLSGIFGKCNQIQRLTDVGHMPKKNIIAVAKTRAAKPCQLLLGDLFMAIAAQNERETEKESGFHGFNEFAGHFCPRANQPQKDAIVPGFPGQFQAVRKSAFRNCATRTGPITSRANPAED